jgi:hypothetical protein
MSCILYQGTCTFLCDVLSVFVTVMLPASYTRIKFSVLLTLRSEIFFYQRYGNRFRIKYVDVWRVYVCVFSGGVWRVVFWARVLGWLGDIQ